jgi:hypothetical protein
VNMHAKEFLRMRICAWVYTSSYTLPNSITIRTSCQFLDIEGSSPVYSTLRRMGNSVNIGTIVIWVHLLYIYTEISLYIAYFMNLLFHF